MLFWQKLSSKIFQFIKPSLLLKRLLVYSWIDIFRMTALGLIYAFVAKIILANFSTDTVSPVWPPSGVALAGLLLGGIKLWPGISLSVFIANSMAGKSVAESLAFAVGNTLEPVIAVWLLSRTFQRENPRYSPDLEHPNDYLQLALATIIAVSAATFIGALGLFLAGGPETLFSNMLRWWIADLLGIAILTPFILTWRKLPKDWFEDSRNNIETIAFVSGAFLTGQIVFLGWFQQEVGPIARAYWLSIFVVWGAIRFGRHGTLLIISMAFVQAMIGTSQQIGFFGKDLEESGLMNMQLTFLVFSVVGLLLALVIHELRKSQAEVKLASLVYQKSSEAMLVLDMNQRIMSVNPAFTEVTGYQPDEVIGKPPEVLSAGTYGKDFYRIMWQSIITTGKWQGEIQNHRKNGELFTGRIRIDTIYNQDGTIQGWIGLLSDISERKKNEELIWKQANYDLLTELPNRWMMYDRLNEEIKHCQHNGKQLVLIFIDLDRFREINETLSHQQGDQLLKEVARRLVTLMAQEVCTIGRLGGDEFAVVLSRLDERSRVEYIVNSIMEKLAAPYQLEHETVYVTASIGVSFYPENAKDAVTLLKCADQALYAAKHGGRNCFYYYTPAMQEAVNIRMRLANDLRFALQKDQLILHYQPIVDLSTNSIHKAEALIRWQHPNLGMISPDKFIPIAEETGLIIEIGEWVFHQAAAQSVLFRAAYNPDFQISINKSPIQFKADPSKCLLWFEHLEKLGLPGQSIVVEITESLLMEAKDNTSDYLLILKDHGMQVALDDFGTGYSSLAYLKRFDIDYIKIDQSFVRNLNSDSNDLALCEAMIVMAHKLGLKVIAEGVETWSQCELLRKIGCDYAQGYFFSPPVPADEFGKLFDVINYPRYSGDS